MKAIVAALALAACGGTPHVASHKEDAIVFVGSNVKDAQLFVDGRFVATLEALRGGVSVEPGAHRLELRHDDFFSSYAEVTVGKSERKKLSLDMAPILP